MYFGKKTYSQSIFRILVISRLGPLAPNFHANTVLKTNINEISRSLLTQTENFRICSDGCVLVQETMKVK